MKRVSQSPTASIRYEEQRQSPRRKSMLVGKLVFGDEHFSMDCVIRDISRDGARVEVSNAHFVPNLVTLLAPKTGMAYEAHTKSRRGNMLGLSFNGTIDLEGRTTVRTRILKQLMVEMQARSSVNS